MYLTIQQRKKTLWISHEVADHEEITSEDISHADEIAVEMLNDSMMEEGYYDLTLEKSGQLIDHTILIV